jgi:hypothetical protein
MLEMPRSRVWECRFSQRPLWPFSATFSVKKVAEHAIVGPLRNDQPTQSESIAAAEGGDIH